MQTTPWKPWIPRLAACAVAALLAATAVFWVLRWPVPDSGPALPAALAPEAVPATSVAALARLLGANAATEAAPAAEAGSRFRLTGVVALGAGQGVALLAIDGKPARPYRVGSVLEEGWVLQSVAPRRVALGAERVGPVRMQLELPPRQP